MGNVTGMWNRDQILHAYLNSFWFSGKDVSDSVIVLLVEGYGLDVVKDAQQVSLDGVGVRRLSENLQEGRIRHEEETREDEPLLLQVASEGLLAELQLLQEVWEQLPESLVSNTALDHVGRFMSLCHDLHPRLVNTLETLCFLQMKYKQLSLDFESVKQRLLC